MTEKLHDVQVCEQCGGKSAETYTCNTCGMIICADCLASHGRTAPCHCVWIRCTGWLKPTTLE